MSYPKPLAPRRMIRLAAALAVAGLLLFPAVAGATRDDDRAARIRERITTLTALVAEKADPAEKERLIQRLEYMKQDLAIVERRQAIDAQEHALQTLVLAQPRELLRGLLQNVPADTAALEQRVRDLAARRARATGEREDLRRQLEAPPPPDADAAAASKREQLEESLGVKEEELRAVALQQEAADVENDLIAQAQALRERLRGADANAHLSLRGLYEQGLALQGGSASSGRLATRLENVEANLRNSESAIALARAKQERYDEEIKLLQARITPEKPRPKLERFLAAETAQRNLSGARVGFLNEQADALRKTRGLLATQQQLADYGQRFLHDQFRSLWLAYVRRLAGPLGVAVVLIAVYLLISRLMLPRRYHREELFLARRLGRYATVLLVAAVGAAYLIEDITTLATTLGLVSAALVISLQDVCASFFAWFVIMLGRKFTIGDRLEVDGTKGDVLDIQLLRTTLVEVNGWLGTDQPTGRIIVIPNNTIFKSKVFNYSHGHPFIWAKIDVTVTYATPVAPALALFRKVLEEETREEFETARQAAAKLERRYGVADAEYVPKIHTHIADSGVTFVLFFVSHYRKISSVRNRINRRLIAEIEKHPQIQLAYNTVSVLTSQAPEGPSAVLGTDTDEPPFSSTPQV